MRRVSFRNKILLISFFYISVSFLLVLSVYYNSWAQKPFLSDFYKDGRSVIADIAESRISAVADKRDNLVIWKRFRDNRNLS